MLASIKITGEIQVNQDSGSNRETSYLLFKRERGQWTATGVRKDGEVTPAPPCFSPNDEVIEALDKTFARVLRTETREA